jgi:transposase-like protein
MNLLDFSSYFPDEDTCIEHFKAQREKIGVVCKKCNGTLHYWKKDKIAFQCKQCGYRTALRSGTILESSHLPYIYWYKALIMLSSTKKTFSANEIQSQLRHEIYEPIWSMLHKIRVLMGKRDSRYKLSEYIEIDEGFFETLNTDNQKDNKLKRGRGSQKQAKVLVLIESKPVIEKSKKNKHKPDRQAGHLKMIVMNDLKANSINKEVRAAVDYDTIVLSDGYNGYNKLEMVIKQHVAINTSEIKEVHTVLPWVHSAIGNAKKILDGIHHSNGQDYLQNYLNEYCYKYNRRYFGEKLFDRLLIACIENS